MGFTAGAKYSANVIADTLIQPVFRLSAYCTDKARKKFMTERRDQSAMRKTDAAIRKNDPDYQGSIAKAAKCLRKIARKELLYKDVVKLAEAHPMVQSGLLPTEWVLSDSRIMKQLYYRHLEVPSQETTKKYFHTQESNDKFILELFKSNEISAIPEKISHKSINGTTEILMAFSDFEKEMQAEYQNYNHYKNACKDAYYDVYDILHNKDHHLFETSKKVDAILLKTECEDCDALRTHNPEEYKMLCKDIYRERCEFHYDATNEDLAAEQFQLLSSQKAMKKGLVPPEEKKEEEKKEEEKKEEEKKEEDNDRLQTASFSFDEWLETDTAHSLKSSILHDIKEYIPELKKKWRKMRDIHEDILCYIEKNSKKLSDETCHDLLEYPHARRIIFHTASHPTPTATEESKEQTAEDIEAPTEHDANWSDLPAEKKHAFNNWLEAFNIKDQKRLSDQIIQYQGPISKIISQLIRAEKPEAS